MRRLTVLFASLCALVLAFGVVGSAAWFTGQDTIPVTGTTGRIVFQTGGPYTAGITLANLLPGAWTSQYSIDVYNTEESTTAVKYRITDAFGSESVAGLYAKVNVRVRHTHCGAPTPASWPVVYNGPIGALDLNSIDHAIADTLGVNITHCYFLDFQLDPTAGNVFQNRTTTFNLVFDATQPENPGWAE
ncbi:MAG TPA: hypothetical protein VLM76_15590 [Patescibacteria group bacterium]|nr:hypothetical protein [Patescibacteria group bacterium]